MVLFSGEQQSAAETNGSDVPWQENHRYVFIGVWVKNWAVIGLFFNAANWRFCLRTDDSADESLCSQSSQSQSASFTLLSDSEEDEPEHTKKKADLWVVQLRLRSENCFISRKPSNLKWALFRKWIVNSVRWNESAQFCSRLDLTQQCSDDYSQIHVTGTDFLRSLFISEKLFAPRLPHLQRV